MTLKSMSRSNVLFKLYPSMDPQSNKNEVPLPNCKTKSNTQKSLDTSDANPLFVVKYIVMRPSNITISYLTFPNFQTDTAKNERER